MILQMSLSTEICVNTSSVFVRSVMPSFLDELCLVEVADAMFAKWTVTVDGTTFGNDLILVNSTVFTTSDFNITGKDSNDYKC